MLYWAKSSQLESSYNQLSMIWNKLDVPLRRDIPEPTPMTTLSQFYTYIDSKTSIWQEMAERQQRFQGQQQSGPQQARDLAKGPYKGPDRRFPQRLLLAGDNSNGKQTHAYLADVTDEGYAMYETEQQEQDQFQWW